MSTIHTTNTPTNPSINLPFPQHLETAGKGLARANTRIQVIGKAVKQMQDRSNCSELKGGFIIFLAIYTKRLFNIRFSDLQISEFKPAYERSTRLCVILLISLLTTPKSSKCKIITDFGLHYGSAIAVLNNLVDSGYIRRYAGKLKYCNALGNRSKDLDLLELTAKGYDKIDFIFSLLIDKRLL